MIAGILLKVVIQELVAGCDDQCGSQLEGTTPRIALPVPTKQCFGSGNQLPGADQGGLAHRTGTRDLRRRPLFVEQNVERNRLIVNECFGVALASGADCSHIGASIENFLVSVTNLTGSLTARKSAEMAEKEDHLRFSGPSIAETVLILVGVDQHLVCELRNIE